MGLIDPYNVAPAVEKVNDLRFLLLLIKEGNENSGRVNTVCVNSD